MLLKASDKALFTISTLLCFCFYVLVRDYPVFYPYHFVRAAAGLSLGTITFFLSKRINLYIKNRNSNKWKRWAECILLSPVIICALNLTNTLFNLIIIAMFVGGFSLLFSVGDGFKINKRLAEFGSVLSYVIQFSSI